MKKTEELEFIETIDDACNRIDIEKVFYSLPMSVYVNLTKRVIRALSHTMRTDAIGLTCKDIIAGGFTDGIMEDLVSEIAVSFCEYMEKFTIATKLNNKEYMIVPVDGEMITYTTKTGKKKAIPVFAFLCKVIRDYFDRNTNKAVPLVVDTDFSDDEREKMTKEELSQIAILSDRQQAKGYNLYLYMDFMHFLDKKCHAEKSEQLAIFCQYLSNGYKINRIAKIMNIPETKAYFFRKEIARLFSDFMPIERRTVHFAKVDCIKSGWIEDNNGNSIISDIPDIMYVRVEKRGAKSIVGEKVYNTSVYLSQKYTSNNGFSIHDRKIEKNIVSHGGEIIKPKEHTRISSYVVNMTKTKEIETFGNKTYIPEKSASGSYNFKYGDVLTGYQKPKKARQTEVCKFNRLTDRKTVTRHYPVITKLPDTKINVVLDDTTNNDTTTNQKKSYRTELHHPVLYPWHKEEKGL